jgi:hypothetical protein
MMLLVFALEWLYPVYFEAAWHGATPGKRVCKLAVLRDDGGPIDWGAAMIRNTLRTSDVAARLADGAYGLMLEDTPEDGAVWAVERLRRSLGAKPGVRTLRAGVACYPGQALTPTELLECARQAFAAAREWPQDRIEVAATEG